MAVQQKLDGLVAAIGTWGNKIETSTDSIIVPIQQTTGLVDEILSFKEANAKLSLISKKLTTNFRVAYTSEQRSQFLNSSDKTDIYDSIENEYLVWVIASGTWTTYPDPANHTSVLADSFYLDIITNDVWYKSLDNTFFKIITGTI